MQSSGSEQLMMYVGVWEALENHKSSRPHGLFTSRNESHRFVVLAPTGTAAVFAWLHYHHFRVPLMVRQL